VRIAWVEDDPLQAELIAAWLEAADHDCVLFHDGMSFMRALGRESFDLLGIDWVLPDIDGDEIVRWVRANLDWHVPVLFVTQRDDERDVVRALELGADDYMVKPVRQAELLARCRALTRRLKAGGDQSEARFGPFHVDRQERVLFRDGRRIALTHKEFELAQFLFANPGRILSRGHILESVWGHSADLNTRTVDTHVSRLRTKLGLNDGKPVRLTSIYQHGYRLELVDEPAAAHSG
jgi:DNA-binding response OmpR family regulator